MKKERLHYVDLVKTIAIFMVITLHNSVWQTDFMATRTWQAVAQFSIRLVCEAVPIFMLVNGFLLFGRNFDSRKHIRRTAKVFLMILVWSVILEVCFALLRNQPITLASVLNSVLNTYIANSHTGVLWFLQKLVVVYLVFPVIKYVYDNKFRLFRYLMIVLLISTYSINLVSLLSTLVDNQWLKALLVFMNQYSVVFTTNIYMVYFMFGGYLAHEMDKVNHKLYIAAGAVCFVLAAWIGIQISLSQGSTYSAAYNYSHVFLFFSIAGMFLLCSRIPLKNVRINRILASISNSTMGVYLIHRVVIFCINRFVTVAGLPFFQRMAASVLVLLISWGITVLLSKIPKISYLVKL